METISDSLETYIKAEVYVQTVDRLPCGCGLHSRMNAMGGALNEDPIAADR